MEQVVKLAVHVAAHRDAGAGRDGDVDEGRQGPEEVPRLEHDLKREPPVNRLLRFERRNHAVHKLLRHQAAPGARRVVRHARAGVGGFDGHRLELDAVGDAYGVLVRRRDRLLEAQPGHLLFRGGQLAAQVGVARRDATSWVGRGV